MKKICYVPDAGFRGQTVYTVTMCISAWRRPSLEDAEKKLGKAQPCMLATRTSMQSCSNRLTNIYLSLTFAHRKAFETPGMYHRFVHVLPQPIPHISSVLYCTYVLSTSHSGLFPSSILTVEHPAPVNPARPGNRLTTSCVGA